MINTISLSRYANGKNKGLIKSPVSKYIPSKKERERIEEIKKKFERSYSTMRKTFRQFNNKSVLELQDECQKLFLNYRPPRSTDPDEAWKSDTIRPIVRNRSVSIAAHMTKQVMKPTMIAQNDQQVADSEAAVVMENLMEFANYDADYERMFFYAVISAIVNPAVIIHSEYRKAYRTIKEVQEDGTWKEREILDEENSGFKDTIVPIEELYISDMFQHDIQKQDCLIWRRIITYEAAMGKYGNRKNFDKVKPGVQVIFDAGTDTFYEQYDEELAENLVEELIYLHKGADLQVAMLNGVLMDDPDQPNPRLDKKYPFTKSGYELIDEGRFFYYFSLVRKMKDDAEVINTLYRMLIDGTYLKVMPPQAIFGDDIINSNVIYPGQMTTFGKDSKLQPIDIGVDLNAGLATLQKTESSLSESSNDTMQSGQVQPGSQTAFEISRLEQNAMIMLGLFGKMIAFLVRDWGELRVGDIVQHLTVAEVDEIVGDNASLKYRSFLVPGQVSQGQKVNNRIVFGDMPKAQDENQMGEMIAMMEGGADMNHLDMDQEKKDKYLKKGVEGDTRLFIVNPELFRNLKYKVMISPEMSQPQSENFKKALALEEFDRLIELPFVDHEAVTKDLLLGIYEATKFNVDKYIKKEEMLPPVPEGMPQGGTPQGQPSVLNKLMGTGRQQDLQSKVL